MRFIGLDIGRDFAHVAVVDGGGPARRLPRVGMGDDFRAFAATLTANDAVALEASTNTWALVDLLGRHAGSVVVSNPLRTRAIASAKRKTDDIDAATLAELLAADYLPPVWQPDEATRRLRRLVSHRAGLVRDRTAVRNRVIAVLSRQLLRSPATDLFGVRGRTWLGSLELPPDERLTVDAALKTARVPSYWPLRSSKTVSASSMRTVGASRAIRRNRTASDGRSIRQGVGTTVSITSSARLLPDCFTAEVIARTGDCSTAFMAWVWATQRTIAVDCSGRTNQTYRLRCWSSVTRVTSRSDGFTADRLRSARPATPPTSRETGPRRPTRRGSQRWGS